MARLFRWEKSLEYPGVTVSTTVTSDNIEARQLVDAGRSTFFSSLGTIEFPIVE
jgi:hypothetical protein